MSVRPIDAWLAEHGEGLIATRRHLHAHPELSRQEHATTEFLMERLELAGTDVRRFASGTGLVCDVGEANGEPRLAFRADIDALGMDDEKDVPYRSQVPGVCHACGHDVHTVVSLGAALYYAHHLDELPGPLRFVFQPAEEQVPGGALDVLADGGIDGVDAIVGLHCWPKVDVGVFGLRSGSVTSAADRAEIVLHGPGGHTARPEETVDMLRVAASVVADLPREVDALIGEDGAVKLVFGSLHGGDAANVIPTTCELKASVRTPRLDVWETLPALVEKALQRVLDGTGAEFDLDYTSGVPPVVNDATLIDTVGQALRAEFGPTGVVEAEHSWGGDDFAWYSREISAAFVRLGVHDPAWAGRLDLHVGRFDVDERSIAHGVRALVAIADAHFDRA